MPRRPAPPAARDGHDADDARDNEHDDAPPGRVRLDKWLWAARFYKTRALAAEAIDGGKVDVHGERAKRARLIGVGDVVRFRHGPVEWEVVVRDPSPRRGSAAIAQALYEETPEGQRRRTQVQEQLRQMPRIAAYGDSRPGKRDRRALRRLKGED